MKQHLEGVISGRAPAADFSRFVALGREIISQVGFVSWSGEMVKSDGVSRDVEGHWVETSMGEGSVYDPFLVPGTLSADGEAARCAFAIGWSLRRGVKPAHQKGLDLMCKFLEGEVAEGAFGPVRIHPMASDLRGARLWYACVDQLRGLNGGLLHQVDVCRAEVARLSGASARTSGPT